MDDIMCLKQSYLVCEFQQDFLFQKKSQVSTRLFGKSLKTDRNKWGGNVFNIHLQLSVQRKIR